MSTTPIDKIKIGDNTYSLLEMELIDEEEDSTAQINLTNERRLSGLLPAINDSDAVILEQLTPTIIYKEQSWNEDQKEQARINIGAGSQNDIESLQIAINGTGDDITGDGSLGLSQKVEIIEERLGVLEKNESEDNDNEGTATATNAVLYTEQTLDNTQQEQARKNIGASSQNDIDELQITIDDLKTTTNTQINSVTESLQKAILYDEQTLKPEQQSQARANIDAVGHDLNSKMLTNIGGLKLIYGSSSEPTGAFNITSEPNTEDEVGNPIGVCVFYEDNTDGGVILRNIAPGVNLNDAVTMQQLNATYLYNQTDLTDKQKTIARENINAMKTIGDEDLNLRGFGIDRIGYLHLVNDFNAIGLRNSSIDDQTSILQFDSNIGQDTYPILRGLANGIEESDAVTINQLNFLENTFMENIINKEQLTPLFANTIEECTDTTKLYVLPDNYIYAYIMTQGDMPEITIEEKTGGYWYADTDNPMGTFNAHDACCAKRTNLIPVTPGDILAYKGHATSTPDSVVWLNSQQAFISDEKISSPSSFTTITVPENASYVWFGSFQYTTNINAVVLEVKWISCQTATPSYQWANTGHAFIPADYEDRIITLENKTTALEKGIVDSMQGKKIIYDGDSICMGYNAGGGYASKIAEITNGTYDNQAEGGGRLCSHDTDAHSVVDNIINLPADGDLYCFQGGINDYWANTSIGSCTVGDYTGELDTTTICGALETIFRYALTNFIGKPICFIITHKIQQTAYQQNNAGHTFEDYRNAMIEVCKKYSIPYYDAFSESGLNGWNTTQSNAYLTGNSSGTADGIHPNEEGYKRYYIPQLLNLFRRIMPIS